MRSEILRDGQALGALAAEWAALEREGEAGLFLSHRWLEAWWRAYRGIDELWLLVARDPSQGDRLAGAWPLHLRAPRSGALRMSELRLVGDLGAGGQRSILCRPGELDAVVESFVAVLDVERGWDLLEASIHSHRAGDAIARAVEARGMKSELTEVPGRAYVDLPPLDRWDEFLRARRPTRTLPGAEFALAEPPERGLEELLRLLRKEWTAREAASPAADPQAIAFLGEIVPQLHARGAARLGLLAFAGDGARPGAAVAADLVVVDGDRHVQLLRGADPEHAQAGAAIELAVGELKASAGAGAHRFEFAPGGDDSPLKAAAGRSLRLRLWNRTTVGRLHRGVSSLAGAVRAIDSGGSQAIPRALDRLRDAAPDVVQRAVARVATYATLHLYRGELFTRDVRESGDLRIRLLPRADFEALSDNERDALAERLDLQLGYCRQKWDRGDTVVLAEIAGRAAGIVWCARSAVYVPDIGREVRPGSGECYIHDVYVHPDERGRQVAPAMLDFLARELRARDVYRAWALIERTNVASTRAFEKAAYASVADVVYARMGLASRLVVRPPDPEARAFLGLG
jgi:ribosomal protein S18 acetylase RimI-like enzyme